MGHVLGLVKSNWLHAPLDLLGEGARSDCSDDQFDQYITKTSPIADRIVDSLSRPDFLRVFVKG